MTQATSPCYSEQGTRITDDSIEDRCTTFTCSRSRVQQLTALFEHKTSSPLARSPLSDIPLEAIALAHDACDTARTMESIDSDAVHRHRRQACNQQSICIEERPSLSSQLEEPTCDDLSLAQLVAPQPEDNTGISKWLDGTLAKLGDITQAHDRSVTSWRSLPIIGSASQTSNSASDITMPSRERSMSWLPERDSKSSPVLPTKVSDCLGKVPYPDAWSSEVSVPSSILRNSSCNAMCMDSKELTSSTSLKRKRIAKRCSFTTDDDTTRHLEPLNPSRSQTRLPTLTRKSQTATMRGPSLSSLHSSPALDTESVDDDVPGSCTAIASMTSQLTLASGDVDTAYMKFFPRVPPSLPYRVILERQAFQCPSCSRLLLLPRNAASSFIVGLAEAAGFENVATRFFGEELVTKRRAFALPPEASVYCNFSGLLFCQSCHIHESMILPANVISAWDFAPKEISRPAARFLRQHHKSPFLHYKALHPAVKKTVPTLSAVHASRRSLIKLKDFFLLGRTLTSRIHRDRGLPIACDVAASDFCGKLLEEIIPILPGEHWIATVDLYSLYDLEAIQTYANKDSQFSLRWASPKKLIGDVFGCVSPPLTARTHLPRRAESEGERCSSVAAETARDGFIYEMQKFVADWQQHVRKCNQCANAAAANNMLACLD